MPADVHMPVSLDDIIIPQGRREVVQAEVKKLAASIEEIGLKHPITVRRERGGEKYVLVAGLHRMEACRKLGREHVPAVITSMTNDEARLWEISENLHRAELSKFARDQQIAEWIKITEKRAHNAQVSGGRGNEGGLSAAARELGIDRRDAQRAKSAGDMTPEAKEAVREHGLENSRMAYLEAAAAPSEQQAAKVLEIASRKGAKLAADPLNDSETKENQVAALMAAWNRASADAREEFLSRIERPVMDRRFG